MEQHEPDNIQVIGRNRGTETGNDYCFTCCHPSGKGHRLIILILMCFLGFGSNFCYDNPGALQDHFKHDLNITETQFTALYSVYSWPNVVMCFLNGFLIDRLFGIQVGSSVFMAITLLGQLFFTFAVYVNQYWMMIIGRFIFGIGAESLAIAQNNYAVLWFKENELNMAFGLQMSFANVGSTVNFWIMEHIYQWISHTSRGTTILGISLLIASTTCVFSMACSLLLGCMYKRSERNARQNTQDVQIVKITDVTDFKLSFWLVACICVTYANAIFPFVSIAQGFFTNQFDMSDQDADNVSSLIYLISAIASPVTGLLIDKVGLNLLWILISITLTIIAHLLLGFTVVNPYIGVVVLGLAYSILASGLWPLVALIIPKYQLGTAYGVCQAFQNLGLAVVAIITGWIVDSYGYQILSGFFVANLFLAFICGAMLLLLDQHHQGILNLTSQARDLDLLTVTLERHQLIVNAEGDDSSLTSTS